MNLKSNLILKLVVAMAVGSAIGLTAPACVIRALNSFGGTFGQFIKFVVPFIIVGLVTPAIAEAGRSAGRTLLVTMGLAYASTLLAGGFAFGISRSVFPLVLDGALDTVSVAKVFPAYFKLDIPPVMSVTTALATAFAFGLSMVAVKSDMLTKLFGEVREVVLLTIKKAVVPLLPLYILTIIADIAASGRLSVICGSCLKISIVALATTLAVLLLQYLVAGAVAGRNPLKAMLTMLPAYLTGWGCCSSAATIPVTLRQTKANGVSNETADLVIPLCANIHLAGSMANMVVYAAGLMVIMGEALPPTAFAEYILMISVIAIAAPGVPGGVVLASAAIAESALGFTPERYAIMMAAYMALDGMGTACNLTGDGAIALIVDRFRRHMV